jgi:hypothetical protein
MERTFKVKVQPRARKRLIEETGPGEFKVCVFSPAEKGAANREVLRLLADYLGVPPSKLKIIQGERSHQKVISLR